jgi:glucosyl-3-phosphoglycerate synthase
MKLSPPDSALRACVVVPARNEEALVGANLSALAMQANVPPEQYEVLLVLDRCTDGTGERAMEVAGAHPSLRLHLLEGPGLGSGHARRAGMEAACERLTGLGRQGGLIASTDADTVVVRDWLSAQLAATARGARAIGGRIELDVGSLPQAVVRWQAKRGRTRHQRILSDPDRLGTAEHWQFSGASLSLTAETYAQVGGLEPRATLEDERLERILSEQHIPIERLLSVRVTTSSRLQGRASRGLAHDLAAAAARLYDPSLGEAQDLEADVLPAG